MSLRTIEIDGESIDVAPELTLLQACELAGREIPRFCYHERLSIAGNCRMCLVEVKGGPKPVASCAMQVRDLRAGPDGEPPAISTTTDTVRRAREGVMEFLLINHPLDCPVCDQGGECDLQDQAMAFGTQLSRYREPKRAQAALDLGPLVKTEMTRCIHCTRCVRFLTEVAGVPELGMVGRGEDAAIVPYLDRSLNSELQGNIVDLCPVGALTSKPYAFTARPWELRPVETVDAMDALGAAIRVDVRGREVMRILPRNHDDINEEWIADRTRFVWDGLGRQRLDRPYLRGEDGRLAETSWQHALAHVAEHLKATPPERIVALAGGMAPVETMWSAAQLLRQLGVANIDSRPPSVCWPAENPAAWRFSCSISGVDQASGVLLVGVDPRMDCPVLNARIRQAWLTGSRVGCVGPDLDSTYPVESLGEGPTDLAAIADSEFGQAMGERPLVILGTDAVARPDGLAVIGAAMNLAERLGAVKDDWTGFGVLHRTAAAVGGLEAGFVPGDGGRDAEGMLKGVENGEIDLVLLLGADEIPMERLGRSHVVYVGSHGDAGAERADVVLPGAAWTEQDGLYVNLEGRPQLAVRAVFPPGEAREEWKIFRALSGEMGSPLPFNDLDELRGGLFADHPGLAAIDAVPKTAWRPEAEGALVAEPFTIGGGCPYLRNPIARASEVMAELSQRRKTTC